MRMASLAATLLVLGRVFSPSRAAPLGRSALGKSSYTCMHCSRIALALFACICVQTAAAEIELMSTSVHAEKVSLSLRIFSPSGGTGTHLSFQS